MGYGIQKDPVSGNYMVHHHREVFFFFETLHCMKFFRLVSGVCGLRESICAGNVLVIHKPQYG